LKHLQRILFFRVGPIIDLILIYLFALPFVAFFVGGLAGGAFGNYELRYSFPFFFSKSKIQKIEDKEEESKVEGIREKSKKMPEIFEYDIAISFADENREIAENFTKKLQMKGLRVFYDEFYKHELWGKKLTEYFQDIYGQRQDLL
jgi:hypothetical protein